MVTKEVLKGDDRFYIDDWDLERFIAHKEITKYRVKNIKVGNILRKLHRRIYPLNESDVYKCLEQDAITKEDYERYRKYCFGDDYEHHTLENFRTLQEDLKSQDYDIKKGAIVVDQFNCIIDGQHRSCILLMKHGPNYVIPVVEVTYKKAGRGMRLRYLLFLLKRKLGIK